LIKRLFLIREPKGTILKFLSAGIICFTKIVKMYKSNQRRGEDVISILLLKLQSMA
jgi:hypothetical protein